MEKYHNNKNKKLKKGIATALMGTVLVAPIALSSASVNADTVPAGSQSTQTEWVANSVSTVRAEMQAQGLNLSHVQGKYIVRKGDTLLAISQAANESMAEIAKVNHITNLNLIYVGQVLYLGSNGAVKAQSASANNEVTNNAGTGVAANVMSNGGNTTGTSIATPANSGIYRGFTGNGTVAAHPSRTAEQARNAAKVGMSTSTSANSHADAVKTSAKHEAPAKVDTSTKAPAKADTSSAKASSVKSSANAGTSKVSSSASSVKSSVASSTTSSAKHSSAVSSSTPAKASSATSSSASHVNSSTANKPAASTTSSSASSKAPVASSTASSQAQSSQTSKPAASTTSSSTASSQASSTASSVDYNKGVVNADGTVNYQAAINQKGPWQGKSATPGSASNHFYDSAAEQTWEQDHPGVQMTSQGYSDGTSSRVPVYSGQNNLESGARPELSQSQLNDANNQMQKNVNASQTFGNDIQWVSSDYKGQVVGTRYVGTDNPVNTPYQNYGNHTGEIIANNVKNDWSSNTDTSLGGSHQTTPEGAHYVSSNMTNKPVSQQTPGQGSDGCNQTVATLTFYK